MSELNEFNNEAALPTEAIHATGHDYIARYMVSVLQVFSLVAAVAFIIWVGSASEPKALAQRDLRYNPVINERDLSTLSTENAKDIVRLQEILKMNQKNWDDLSNAINEMRKDNRDLHSSIDQIKGGVYVFVPLLGVLNLLGFIAGRRRGSGGGGGGGVIHTA